MPEPQQPAPAALGIPGSTLPGPYPVGEYATALQRRLRDFAKVQLIGELVNLRISRARAYFELRDASGAIPCAAWLSDWEQMRQRSGELADGMQIVVQGGCDYYAGSASSSPSFSFSVSDLRIAGEGDLLARIERLRKALDAEGLLERQKRLPLPSLPRSIAVLCSESGKARDDILAGLARRGWSGRIVWAYAPVQDRYAAPAITGALQDSRGLGTGRGRDRRPRRRLARGPALLLRRDPVQDGRNAGDPRDRLSRASHRQNPARRCRRDQLLDTDARG